MPESVLKPGDYDPNRQNNRGYGGGYGGYNSGGNGAGNNYRPRMGFNANNDYRPDKNPIVANRMLQ